MGKVCLFTLLEAQHQPVVTVEGVGAPVKVVRSYDAMFSSAP